MSKLVHEVRHFVLREDAVDASHDDIAAEAVDLAKGGHIVNMELPGGAVVVMPDHAHEDVVPKVADAMPKTRASKGKSPPPPPEAA